MHAFPVSQVSGGPPTQAPFEQASLVVQALPSSQGAVLFVWTQPVAGLHDSLVHGLPSLQLGGGPAMHWPAAQVSFVVQAFPSSQIATPRRLQLLGHGPPTS